MRRLTEQLLEDWKDSGRRKPLIIRGARQVGKTYTVKWFGQQHFQTLAAVDLERNRGLHRIFSDDLDPHRIIRELELQLSVEIRPGKTLLFFDEIQSCPRAIMALRYFQEELPELHVVAAGSLLEFALGDLSFPIGRVRFLDMHPLSFAEYMMAIGREDAARLILSSPEQLPKSTHKLLLDELRIYFFVGGMPEAVKTYAETKSIQEAFEVHKELTDALRHDFPKYSPKVNSQCLDAVLAGAARYVGKQVIYTHLAEGFSQPTIKKAFDSLCNARILTRVRSAKPRGLPLEATASPKKAKAVLVDIGLWQHLCGVRVSEEFQKVDLLDMHRGAMAEQFVGQEMLATAGRDLYYWAREAKSSTAEVDYLAVSDGRVVPIEVKSGAAGRLRSMHMLLEKYPDVPLGVVLSSQEYSELPEQRLRFVPIYYAHFYG